MNRVFDLLYHQLEHHPQKASVCARDSDGNWKSYSSQDIANTAEKAAAGLLQLGLRPGDAVALVSYKNRPEWLIMDFAIQMAGMVSIPLYPTISIREYQYILHETKVKAAFCGGLDLFEKLSAAGEQVPSLEQIFTFDQHPDRPYWESILEEDLSAVEKIKASLTGDDLLTIIYTSGTTGNPKGVMLKHSNVMHVIMTTADLVPIGPGEKTISFLPMCHIYERAVSFAYYYKGCSVHYCSTDNLSGPEGDLAAVKPVAFTTVPRLLEKVYEAIYNKGLALKGVKRNLFFWALSLTDDFSLDKKRTLPERFKWAIADRLIFSKWRTALGGNLRIIFTGAAPCPVKILRVFCAAGISVREGYGLTETAPTLTMNTYEPGGAMLGTVGCTVAGVELLIDESSGAYEPGEGEILAHGPNVMSGYYKKPEINKQVFREIDGKTWFCTGDVGTFVEGPGGRKFLKITDRKKELLKTSGGKYVAPAPIENRFLQKGLPWISLEEMVTNQKVIAKYQKLIDRLNPEFSHIEQIKKFRLVPSPWLPIHEDQSEAELTPTLKLKRRVIRRKFEREIEEIYASG